MAKFRCLASGNIVEFTQQVDIDSMKGHEGYVRIDEEVQQDTPVEPEKKRMGRPPKKHKDE